VIPPLLSLMKDQVRNINKNFGISAAAIFDGQDKEILKVIEEGVYLLIYTSPEYLVGKKRWRTLSQALWHLYCSCCR
jgi:superfamily II DNA helicase RecQ